MSEINSDEMNTFESKDVALPDIIRQINSGKLQLPEFQRGWIWDDRHIRDLLVSIAKSFPIGAIMLLENGGELKFQSRLVESVVLEKNTEDPEMLILDGQQRLTSLTQALTSTKPVKTQDDIERIYYVDITKVLNGEKIEDAIIAVNSERQRKTNFGRDVELDLSSVRKECEAFYFPCNQILNSDKWELNLNNFCNEKLPSYYEFRSVFLDKFRYYKIPTIILDNRTKKEAVCLVFEKVNTGGVQLSVFELVTASFAANEFNLREDWFGDEEHSNEGIINILKKEPILQEVKPTDFLQAISLLTTHKQRNREIELKKSRKLAPAVSANRNAILSLSLKNYLEEKKEAVNGFKTTAKFLRKNCIFSVRDLPYQTQIVPFASAFTRLGNRWRERGILNKINRLYWCGVLGEFYSGPVETQMANDLEDLMKWIENDDSTPRTIRDASFNPDRLYTLKTKRSAAYKGIYSIILSEGALDFLWNASIKELDFEEERIDIHHIFPRKWCKNNGIPQSDCDSIINKSPISFKANRVIGGQAPSKYVERLQEKSDLNDTQMNKILKSHGIEPEALRNNDFKDFFSKRKKFLLNLIYDRMGIEYTQNQ